MNDLVAAERSRRNLRIALSIIIVATLPFYCFGLILLTNPPARVSSPTQQAITTQESLPTNTVPGFASVTPLPQQSNSTLQPTPGQFIPPTVVRFITPTFVFPTTAPTNYIFPTLTLAPTLTIPPTQTPQPSWTPFVPTATLPPPTATVPLPTDTALPMPTDTETPTATIEPVSP
ncbi:MAG: hypothetical protein IPK17_10700 [Chloroflexi bacterium]|uniref:hypothetical protein n=1 Tax=Candidatus Flexifilum breve TaxID=3140694 RepID=UPI0031352961|nr:hypothetical protein [Chloroflexota bacterium]